MMLRNLPPGRRWPRLALGVLAALGVLLGALLFPAALTPSHAPPAPAAAPARTAAPAVRAASPTPPPLSGKRVGLQIGHWEAEQLPEEQAHLRDNPGAEDNGVSERDLNAALARLVADDLTAQGVRVDLLPATVPPGYVADAFVSIHADYASDRGLRGYKVGTPWRASPASTALQASLSDRFARSGQPFHDGVNATMRGYYSFNYLRYQHAVDRATPSVIVEAGFISNPADLELLTTRRAETARLIAAGIADYLARPRAAADLLPPELPLVTPLAPLDALSDPDPAAAVMMTLDPGALLWTYAEQDGWYHVVLPPDWDYIGWVPVSAVAPLPADSWKTHTWNQESGIRNQE
jgi:N-acetylmuramoyl-L-alanine amidase